MTKSLCELTQPNVEWYWKDTQASAFEKLKEALTKTPVQYFYIYYSLSDEVIL